MSEPDTVSTSDTQADDQAPEVYRFDQRAEPRHGADFQVTLLRRDHDPGAYRHPICRLQMKDMSSAGIGAICDTPLAVDERVSLYFPAHGPEPGIEFEGHVVRCHWQHPRPEAHGGLGGYDIAIRFDVRAAA